MKPSRSFWKILWKQQEFEDSNSKDVRYFKIESGPGEPSGQTRHIFIIQQWTVMGLNLCIAVKIPDS